ncbi:MAG: RNA polymerase sigma factor [Bacteroidetes bacterium]|nr:RNA polymerase sigma factor [Bacteroidota bacterium]MDA1224734.1 RNA polymerase sigma factor [Bacteroidota bacterium]
MSVDKVNAKNMSESQRLQNLSEDELSVELVSSDITAFLFVEILRRYQQQIYYHCRNLLLSHDDADDAAQNTFIKVWQNANQFKGESRLRTWVYRIATNESINLIRKRKPTIDFDEAQPKMADMITEDLYLSGDDIALKLQKALCYLPFKQKLVFTLRYFEDLSYSEIAVLTSTSEGALKASYHHAVKKLEIYLSVLR